MKILKHCHYCVPFSGLFTVPKLLFGIDEYHTSCIVQFDESIRYHVPEEDVNDVNKLFGISYGFHHQNSDRIGFRYKPDHDTVEIVQYCYVDGVRQSTVSIYEACINEIIDISFYSKLTEAGRTFTVYVFGQKNKQEVKQNTLVFTSKVNLKHKKILNYTLTGYFGGNNRAPQKINIEIEK